MKLLLIRHGDPDYTIDSLTEKGHREAALLAERIAPMDIKAYYVSPLGRAQKTAEYTLEKAGRTAEVLDWAREFDTLIDDGNGGRRIAWDWLPADWKRRYRLRFASMPLWLMVIAVCLAILVIYQFVTADMQPFIYFQF